MLENFGYNLSLKGSKTNAPSYWFQDHQRAIDNFFKVIKPGGMLIIDHRNYDFILDHGYTSQKNIYYNVMTSFVIAIQQKNTIGISFALALALKFCYERVSNRQALQIVSFLATHPAATGLNHISTETGMLKIGFTVVRWLIS